MHSLIDFLFELLKQFFGGIWRAISNFFIGLFEMINIGGYLESLSAYKDGFGILEWILAVLAFLIIIGVFVALVFLIVFLVKRAVRSARSLKHQKELLDEVGELNAQVIRLSKEKDKLLAIAAGKSGGYVDIDLTETIVGSGNGQETNDTALQAGESRFNKLIAVDEVYANYDPASEEFDNDITLEEICDRFRNFACTRMGLFYEKRIIRLFLAGLASTRVIILQGISGTGKTSLPYAWGKFLKNDAQIAAVQPSWRDRTELLGYFNDFTKRYSETQTLKKMYEATYSNKVFFTILDEMNIARVEYYFAEMLSILEMPSRDEWILDLVPSGWDTDPKHIVGGRFKLPENMWYIGTANNDDSTFAISDKVYDRAIPINIDTKGVPFEAPFTDPLCLDYHHLEAMFAEAKEKYKVSAETLEKLEVLDNYVIEHFRLAFGNRIVKQLRDFVPAYVGCGGTEIDGVDYVLTNKILRKFEQLNLAFIRDEIDGLIDYLSELFGEENMQESKAYLNRLKKMI